MKYVFFLFLCLGSIFVAAQDAVTVGGILGSAIVSGANYCNDSDDIGPYIPGPVVQTSGEYVYTATLLGVDGPIINGGGVEQRKKYKWTVEGGKISAYRESESDDWIEIYPQSKLYVTPYSDEPIPIGYEIGLQPTYYLSNSMQVKIRWAEDATCMSVKSKISTHKNTMSFEDKIGKLLPIKIKIKIVESIGPSDKLDVLKVGSLSGLTMVGRANCDFIGFEVDFEEAECGSCGDPKFVWFLDGDEFGTTDIGVIDFYSNIPHSQLEVALRYGTFLTEKQSIAIDIKDDRLSGPPTISTVGETFYLFPGTLGAGSVTDVEWSGSSGSTIVLTPTGNQCFVNPAYGGGSSTITVTFVDACGVSRSLSQTFNIMEEPGSSGGGWLVSSTNTNFESISLSDELNSSSLMPVGLLNGSKAVTSLAFQSPVSMGTEIILQVGNSSESREVVICSSTGAIVSRNFLSGDEINVSVELNSIVPGLYFVTLITPNEQLVTKPLIVN